MIDVARQVAFWREGAKEDLTVARELIGGGHPRQGLFFAHLALEKLLKACVVHHTSDLAPRLHNLVRLAELSGLRLSETQVKTLAEMNVFNLEGRYPEIVATPPDQAEARAIVERASEVFQWLTSQL